MQKVIDGIFGRIKSPEEIAKEWKKKLREEARACDREVRKIEREEAKVKRQLKLSAKHGDKYEIQTLARELIQSKKAKNRLHVAKTNLNSIQMKLGQQMSEYKVLGAVKKSTEIMKMMNDVMSVPEMQKTMRKMAKEMEKAGMIDEMIEDTMENTFDVDETEEDEVVNEIMKEVLGDALANTIVGSGSLSVEIGEKEDKALEKRQNELHTA